MKNVLFLLKAIVITPLVLATGMIMIVATYLVYPVIIIGGIFAILKANEQIGKEDDEDDKHWSKPDRHK